MDSSCGGQGQVLTSEWLGIYDINILFGLCVCLIMLIQMYVNILCINNKMVQEWLCKEH